MDYFEIAKQKIKEMETAKLPKKCPSCLYSDGKVTECGSDWLCDACSNPGDNLKMVWFWSEKFGERLDLLIPEKNLYDAQKVLMAQMAREESKLNPL